MKRIFVLVPILLLLLSSTALAGDGIKVLMGYSGGFDNWRQNNYDSGGNFQSRSKGDAILHGPSGEVTFETGPIFLRGMFDYQWGADVRVWDSANNRVTSKEFVWSGEGDIGYKIYNRNNISVTPYLGGGYRFWKLTYKDDANSYIQYRTPYAAVGGNITYEESKWSVGVDLAGLMLFLGDMKLGSADQKHDTKFGLGGRAMLPMTYSIIPKKAGTIGVMIFAKPYYEYWNSWKTETVNSSKYGTWNSNYGVKAGIGFSF